MAPCVPLHVKRLAENINTDMEKAIVDFEKEQWREAMELFKESSDRDESRTASFLREWDRPTVVKEFFENTKRSADKEYSPRFGRILEKIEVAMTAGDIAMKGAPESVGLAWMGVRMCLSALTDDHTTFCIFGQASMDILGIMISCAVFSRMYGPSRNIEALGTREIYLQVTERIPKVYAAILDFSFSVKKYRSQHAGERFIRSLLRSATDKFTEKLKFMQSHDEQMSKFATIASQQFLDYNQRAVHDSQKLMTSTLDGIKAQLDENLRLREAQAEDFHALRTLFADMNKDMTPHDVALKHFEQNMRKLKATSDQRVELHAKIARRLPEQTCTWIFDQHNFCDWYDSANSAMLWISGGPGVGKSILMAAIIDELQRRASKGGTSGHEVVFFFCNRGAGNTRETDCILNDLLSQVYAHLRESPTETLDKANKLVTQRLGASGKQSLAKAGESTNFANVFSAEFANVFKGLVALLDRQVFAVIDALDECTDRSIGFVETLSAMGDACNSRPGPKVIVCSRPEQDIQDALSRVPTILVENNNGPDIKLNAERQLSSLSGWYVQEKQLACDKIVKQAGSYFRYVDLALEFLKQPWQRPLSTHLERLPEGVDAFYEQIIQTTPPAYVELLRCSLTWTILGGGSVRVPEVIDAYSQIYTTAGIFEHEAVEEENVSELQIHQIRAASVNLLLVDPESLVIQERHSTVSDHFLSRTKRDEEANLDPGSICAKCEKSVSVVNRFDISEKFGHISIASTILQHLMNEGFRKRYLVPHEEASAEDEPTLKDADPELSQKTTVGAPEVTGIDCNEANDSEDMEKRLGEAHMAQKRDKLDENPGPDLKESIFEGDHSDPISDVEQTDDEKLFDLASEMGTVADSDVDQASPMYQPFEGKLPGEFRYEITYCHYHLTKVEELWQPRDRQGSTWHNFEALRDAFFQDESVFFQSWSNLLQQGNWGWSWPSQALHCAARLGLTTLVERLISRGADIFKRDTMYNVMDHAVIYYGKAKEDEVSKANGLRLFETLFRAGIDVNMRGEEDGYEFLTFRFLLVQNPDIDAVELFLKYEADATAVNQGSLISVLHTCLQFCEKPDVLKAIISAGANPNAKDSDGETPLHNLMQRSEVPEGFLQQLLDAKADVNEEDLASQRPLFELCSSSGNVTAAQLLVKYKADVMDIDVNAQTALHVACENGHKNLVIFLIDNGAKVDALDAQNRTPFFLSCCADHDETALYLINHIKQSDEKVFRLPSKDGKTPLRKAAAKGHETIVQALCEKLGYDNSILNEQDIKYQQTPLHVAARNGRKGVVECLLKNEVATNLKDKFGRTALAACLSGWMPTSSGDHQAVCILLIDADNDSNIDNGILQGAAMKGVLPILVKLLDKGADPNRPDEHGWTAIQTARQYGKMEAVELLSSRKVSTALRPTRLRLSRRKDSKSMPSPGLSATDCLAIADHPVPVDVPGFYYEVLIEGSAEVSDITISARFGLCAHQSPKEKYWAPGDFPYQSWGWDGGSGRQKCYPSNDKTELRTIDVKFGKGDVVGCGVDMTCRSMFFTKNGKLVSHTKAGNLHTYYSFTEVSGRVYPVILPYIGTTVVVNFGNGKETPLLWLPGNDRDGGVHHVAREEEELNKKLPRRATAAL
ncbi:hypothetical protein HBH56_185620 [Parastagonospora nodorum]|uniref:B30.2/SPRY domain-containing protein n=1 Tax=Phaeosphaeria nodorum (strain SN15 / ATCC MYA-4574 / FGSC 10173) TaxID=321614 RepID=A0A7U2I446_PHANO|nr:hypothetical protein HBH56_185620 [Parastagonospora nodorum]QRD01085.1 hypothetical protein JI435_153160 [Parastagonospora nodorum SN15]KAH3925417.1 hypothetical protein HBH54_182940 [Parastagonospora nodorum]KAH4127343.1 hypothetical protein HBH45_219850 [Parastagonospora nodorum]KAH4148796.1 hypothetical protein HBH44_203860 [Parastagonospora nodorum]